MLPRYTFTSHSDADPNKNILLGVPQLPHMLFICKREVLRDSRLLVPAEGKCSLATAHWSFIFGFIATITI